MRLTQKSLRAFRSADGHLEKPGYEKIGLLISAKSLNV